MSLLLIVCLPSHKIPQIMNKNVDLYFNGKNSRDNQIEIFLWWNLRTNIIHEE